MIELSTSSTTTTSTTTTITVTGDLDLAERSTFPEITAEVCALTPDVVVVDTCAMTFLDSSGAAFLAGLADRVRRLGGTTVLRGAGEHDLFVLQLCGALPLFRVDKDHPTCAPTPVRGPWGSTRA